MKRIITICIATFMVLGMANASVVESQKLTASDGAAGDNFGSRFAISEDYAIIGAFGDDDNGTESGSAYIFERNAGTWTEVAKLTASDGSSYDQFGLGVGIAGNYAIVGSRYDRVNAYRSGSAYVFERDAGTWTQIAKLSASDGGFVDQFGGSVGMSGHTAIIGAETDDNGNGESAGAAYIYDEIDGIWINTAKLIASDGATGDGLGLNVSISGDYAVIAGVGDDDNGAESGSAYIFERNAGTWTEVAKLTASDGAAGDHFGHSVSISGDYVIIGADVNDGNGENSGSAYVFERNAGSWAEVAKLTASDGATGDGLGLSVSISGGYAIAGAFRDDDNGENSGSAYIFQHIAGSWNETSKLLAGDGAAGDEFGGSASIISEDNTIFIGAHYDDDDNGYRSGSVYVFELLPIADAGGPYVENATGWAGARVTLDGLDSYDPDGDSLTYEWDLNLEWDSDSDGNPSNDVDETRSTADYFFELGRTDIALVVRDETGLASPPDVTSVTVSYIDVAIDIKPGAYPNSINMGSHGVIPVAFLSDETFDASTIDPLTVTLRGEDFNDGLVELRGKKDQRPMASLEDVDGDGDLDLLVKLDTEKLFDYEVNALCVLGALTYDGYVVSGADTIRVVPE